MTTQEQINLIDQLLDQLYSTRATWGGGSIVKYLHKQGFKQLHIGGERTFKRAAEVLEVPYETLVIGGNLSRSYPSASATAVLHYLVKTSEAQRQMDWLALHPEEAIKQQSNRRQGQVKRQALQMARQEVCEWLSFHSLGELLSKQLGGYLGPRGIKAACQRLNIPISNKKVGQYKAVSGINKVDIPALIQYFQTNYSPDPIVRRYQAMYDTIHQTQGKIEQMAKSRSKARAASKLQAIQQLEGELNERVYDSSEAQAYISRNNSTLISGIKLLQLPVYKRVGQFLYPQSSLDALIEFYNSKNGLKGQLARAFERKIRMEEYSFRCEKSYSDLRWNGGKPLRFDYYFPAYNLLVEIQGSQHFKPTTMGADISEQEMLNNFEAQKERDALKIDYCKEHQIPLIIISQEEDFQLFDDFISQRGTV